MSMLHEAKRCGLFPFSWNEYVARSNNEKKKKRRVSAHATHIWDGSVAMSESETEIGGSIKNYDPV